MKKIKNICIVSGAHRSGTTWIGKTISDGTNSSYIWEPFNIRVPNSQRISYGESFLNIKNWYHLVKGSKDEICIDLKNLINQRKLNFKEIISLFPESLHDNRKATIKWFFYNIKLSIALKRNNNVIIKDPNMLLSTKEMSEALGCRCILITKDPRSFYNSLKKASWKFDFNHILYPCLKHKHLNEYSREVEKRVKYGGLIDPQSIGLLWNILHKHIHYLSKFKDFKVIKYEDICKKPISHLNELALFATNKKLSKKIELQINMEQKRKTDNSYSFHMIRHDNSQIISELWKSQLNKKDILEIEKECIIMMDKFKYF